MEEARSFSPSFSVPVPCSMCRMGHEEKKKGGADVVIEDGNDSERAKRRTLRVKNNAMSDLSILLTVMSILVAFRYGNKHYFIASISLNCPYGLASRSLQPWASSGTTARPARMRRMHRMAGVSPVGGGEAGRE